MALDQLSGMLYLLECLGFIINKEKSVFTLCQIIEFLGLTVDSLTMEIRLPPHKIKKIRADARKIGREKIIPACVLARLLGKMNSSNFVIPPAPLFYCHLQMALSNMLEENAQSYEAQIILTLECVEELE